MNPTQGETITSGSIVFSNNRLSYVGQDVHRIPPILARLYGKRVQALDLSYNCLTSLQELGNFPHLTELVLDNNQLGDGIILPYIQTLHTLSLNKNNLTNLDLLLTKVVHNLPNLRYLSLLGNIACPNELSDLEKDEQDYQRYRYYVLYNLPRLQFLDSRPVTAAERDEAARRGQYMKIARPTVNTLASQQDSRYVSHLRPELYSPLPGITRSSSDHQGTYGKCRFRYIGKNSEGNRFIQNQDL